MIVDIQQTKNSLFSKVFIVSIDNKKAYKIGSKAFSLNSVFDIRDCNLLKEIGVIRNKLISILADSKIEIGSEKYSFKQEPLKTLKFICRNQNDENENYLIQSHADNSGSIFRKDIQIAWWDKTNDYKIEMNFDEDPILISIFAVIVEHYINVFMFSGDMGRELGEIGNKIPNRNENWNPKKPGDNKML